MILQFVKPHIKICSSISKYFIGTHVSRMTIDFISNIDYRVHFIAQSTWEWE